MNTTHNGPMTTTKSFKVRHFKVANAGNHVVHNQDAVILEMRGGDKKNDDDCESSESKKRRYTEEGRAKARERFARDAEGQQLHRSDTPPSGFGRRPRDDYSDEDEDSEDHRDRRRGSKMSRRSAGSGCKRLVPGVVRLPQRRPRLL